MADNNSPNYKWIYMYDYALGSVWDVWKTSDAVPEWIVGEAKLVAERAEKNNVATGKRLPCFLLMTDSHFAYNRGF